MFYNKQNEAMVQTLHPKVQPSVRNGLADCEAVGCWIKIIEGQRSWAKQAWDYASGRYRPGKIITYAKPGFSYHQYGVAFDMAPADGQGNLHWDDAYRYQQAIDIFKKHGFESGSDWPPPKTDKPHLQMTFGHDIGWFRAGNKL